LYSAVQCFSGMGNDVDSSSWV